MANVYSHYPYDAALLLKSAALVGASADGSLIVNLGKGIVDADLVIDVTATEIDTTDESYTVIIEGSPDATFGTAGNIVALSRLVLGHASAAAMAPQGLTSVVGRYVLPFRNEQVGTIYPYVRIRTVVAGTIGSGGINYLAFIAPDLD